MAFLRFSGAFFSNSRYAVVCGMYLEQIPSRHYPVFEKNISIKNYWRLAKMYYNFPFQHRLFGPWLCFTDPTKNGYKFQECSQIHDMEFWSLKLYFGLISPWYCYLRCYLIPSLTKWTVFSSSAYKNLARIALDYRDFYTNNYIYTNITGSVLSTIGNGKFRFPPNQIIAT